jgi:hypothetical protein
VTGQNLGAQLLVVKLFVRKLKIVGRFTAFQVAGCMILVAVLTLSLTVQVDKNIHTF